MRGFFLIVVDILTMDEIDGESERGGGEWESGEVGWVGGEGNQKKGNKKKRKKEKKERGEMRMGWNGVFVYDCTDFNEYTRFKREE